MIEYQLFQEFDLFGYMIPGLIFSLLCLILTIASLPIKDIPLSLVNGFLGTVILGGTILGGFMELYLHDQAHIEPNKTIATENLKLKYDIKTADWNTKYTTAKPKDTTGEENIVIESKDSKRYVFTYKVNLDTGEPTLEKVSEPYPEDDANAESLLKNK